MMQRKVDRRITSRPLDISNNASKVNMRDQFFNDVWGRGCNSSGEWFSNIKN